MTSRPGVRHHVPGGRAPLRVRHTAPRLYTRLRARASPPVRFHPSTPSPTLTAWDPELSRVCSPATVPPPPNTRGTRTFTHARTPCTIAHTHTSAHAHARTHGLAHAHAHTPRTYTHIRTSARTRNSHKLHTRTLAHAACDSARARPGRVCGSSAVVLRWSLTLPHLRDCTLLRKYMGEIL